MTTSTKASFLFALILITSEVIGGKNETQVSIKRIVGGSDAVSGSFPFLVSLRDFNYQHTCGGSIVDKKWVITAAHCIHLSYVRYVVAGTIYLDYGGYDYNVQKAIIHPKYDSHGIINDIGLLKILEEFVFSSYIQPIKLPSFNIGSGYQVIVSGWGKTNYQQSNPNAVLQFITPWTISNTKCASLIHPFVIYDAHLCTWMEKGIGICSGDSGGPMVYKNELHGVISFAGYCAVAIPDGYARVYLFNSWILNTISTN